MLRYHVTVINGPLFFVLISRTNFGRRVRIGQIHQNVSLPFSAPLISSAVHAHLWRFPLSGHIPQDKELRNGGYRYVIAGKYICVYRLIAGTVYVYHMAHGASNYPTLFKRLMKEENP